MRRPTSPMGRAFCSQTLLIPMSDRGGAGDAVDSAGLRALRLRCSPTSLRPLPPAPRPQLLRPSLLGDCTADELNPPRRRLSLSFHSAASPQPLSFSENGKRGISAVAFPHRSRSLKALMAPLPPKAIAAAAGIVRNRLRAATRIRGGGGDGASRWTSPGTEERPKGYLFNRTPLPPGESRKWEDWELPCYITSFLTIVILGVGLNAKPDLTIETWAHQKALERLQQQEAAADSK